jgi:hypothetical protein
MTTFSRTMSIQTEKLIKGLEYLLNAREEILTSFTEVYGDEQGEQMYREVYEKDMASILLSLKVSIGDSMETNMSYLDKHEF